MLPQCGAIHPVVVRQPFLCVLADELACSSAAQANSPLGSSQAAVVLTRLPMVPVDSSAARMPATAQRDLEIFARAVALAGMASRFTGRFVKPPGIAAYSQFTVLCVLGNLMHLFRRMRSAWRSSEAHRSTDSVQRCRWCLVPLLRACVQAGAVIR